MANPALSAFSSNPASPGYGYAPPASRRMTIDDVITATAGSIATLVVFVALTWTLLPEQFLGVAWMGGALVGLGLGLWLSFRRKALNPGLVLTYAAIEGVFLGAISKTYASMFSGVVPAAVVGTVAAAGGMLIAYKFFNVRISAKARTFLVAGLFGILGVVVANFALSFAGLGFDPLGPFGMLISAAAVVLGCVSFIADFQDIDHAIASGAPSEEAWRASFGITVGLIYVYVNLLQLLAAFSSD